MGDGEGRPSPGKSELEGWSNCSLDVAVEPIGFLLRTSHFFNEIFLSGR